jgi:hypothetical protein
MLILLLMDFAFIQQVGAIVIEYTGEIVEELLVVCIFMQKVD